MDKDSIIYYSEENGVNVMFDFSKPTYCEEHELGVFYDEELEEKQRKHFEYDDEKEKSAKTFKKTYSK